MIQVFDGMLWDRPDNDGPHVCVFFKPSFRSWAPSHQTQIKPPQGDRLETR